MSLHLPSLRALGDGLNEDTCRRLTLIATVLGSSMAYVTAVNVAIPAIGADLDIGFGGQQWVLLSYSLALASLYLVAGAQSPIRLSKRRSRLTPGVATSAFGGSGMGGTSFRRGSLLRDLLLEPAEAGVLVR